MAVAARFHAVRDRVVAAVDWSFAEPVRILFMIAGNPDPARASVEIEAVVRFEDGGVIHAGSADRSAQNARIAGQPGRAWINRATYTGPVIRKGDRIVLLARDGEPMMDVLRPDFRGHSRIVLELGAS